MQRSKRLDNLKILVIEDTPDLLELTRMILEGEGASVIAFDSVAAALEALRRERADLYIVDIGLPKDNGYVFIARVRLGNDTTPAIALTGYKTSADRAAALAAGFQMHMGKPVEREALIEAVERLNTSFIPFPENLL